jgi:hypothetical protein
MEEPSLRKSSNESDEPKRPIPNTDIELPKRRYDLKDIVEPTTM